jgi:hypothetical protein
MTAPTQQLGVHNDTRSVYNIIIVLTSCVNNGYSGKSPARIVESYQVPPTIDHGFPAHRRADNVLQHIQEEDAVH